MPPQIEQAIAQERCRAQTSNQVTQWCPKHAQNGDRMCPNERIVRFMIPPGFPQHSPQAGKTSDNYAAVQKQVWGGKKCIWPNVGMPLHVPREAQKAQESTEQQHDTD